MARKIYGVRDESIVKKERTVRDIKSPFEIVRDFIHGDNIPHVALACYVAGFFVPLLLYFNLLVVTPIIIYRYRAPLRLPMYVPKGAGVPLDANEVDLKTADKRAGKPKGIHYFGFDPIRKKQVWSTDNVLRQHHFYAATTGGGKTESIAGICANFYIYGSGFILIDGKADLNLPVKLFGLAYRMMRVNDILLVNYIRGGLTMWEPDEQLISNRFNQFMDSTESSISELMKSLLSGDGDIWSKRADDYIAGLTRPLAYQRDMGRLVFSIRSYVEYMELERVGKDIVGNKSIPDEVKASTTNFVRTLPGMDMPAFELIKTGQSIKNNPQVYEQFGYITMQIIPILNMIKGDYGHIFNCVYGHVNMRDVVTSRRSLVTLLPALEKSQSALQALGRVVITATKDMMSMGTGYQLEGEVNKLLAKRFSNCYSPYAAVFDEAAYYAVEFAFAPIFAQARGLGFSAFIALQDINAVKIISDKIYHEIKTTASNAVTKIAGRIEDVDDTLEMFVKRGGKKQVAAMDSLDIDYDPVVTRNVENRTSIKEEDVLSLNDFTSMVEGETIILHKDYLIYCDMFSLLGFSKVSPFTKVMVKLGLSNKKWDDIKPMELVPTLRGMHLNDFTPVGRLDDKEISRLRDTPERLAANLRRIINSNEVFSINESNRDCVAFNDRIVLHEGSKLVSSKRSWQTVVMASSEHRDRMQASFAALVGDQPSTNSAKGVPNQDETINRLYQDDTEIEMDEDEYEEESGGDAAIMAIDVDGNDVPVSKRVIVGRQKKFDAAWAGVLEKTGLSEADFIPAMAEIDKALERDEALDNTPSAVAERDEEYKIKAKLTYDAIRKSADYPGSKILLPRSVETTNTLLENILKQMDSDGITS
ncbi:TPA: TraM recognition domain-containing protein [Aeromonas hydrophila subsp. hydrophila]|uniref:TraM recognition domain-containing protein n=1 Tax=Aeromonas hydrophila TaxID=644 RepID=UPI002ED22EFD|nr:TraM recognition domain-containing protein [Aeromonas hydrophila]